MPSRSSSIFTNSFSASAACHLLSEALRRQSFPSQRRLVPRRQQPPHRIHRKRGVASHHLEHGAGSPAEAPGGTPVESGDVGLGGGGGPADVDIAEVCSFDLRHERQRGGGGRWARLSTREAG